MKKGKVLCFMTLLGCCLMACGKGQSAENVPEAVKGQAQVSLPATENKEDTSYSEKKGSSIPQQIVEKKQSVEIQKFIQGSAWELGNSQGNLLALGYVCENDGRIYYQDVNHEKYLCVMKLDGTEKTTLTEDIPRAIQVVGEYVYYINGDKNSTTYNRIKRVRKDGSDATLLGKSIVGSMLVTEKGIYYTGTDYIARMELDGSKEDIIFSQEGNGDFGWLGIYGDCIITGGVLNDVNLAAVKIDSGEKATLYQNYMFPQIEGDTLYCTGASGTITAISILTGEEKSWENAYGSRSVVVDGKLYYTNGRQICVIEEGKEEVDVLYPVNETISANRIELYGAVNGCIFFSEIEEGETAPVFKYINLETMVIAIVP